jgi:hypothetical protein
MITVEEIGKLLINYPKCKFPNPLLRNGLIRFIDGNESNTELSNFELTNLGSSVLNGTKYVTNVTDDFVENYYEKFTQNILGISKISFSPKSLIKKKLEVFINKYKTSSEEILKAVDFYHENCRNNGNLVFSLDAQYFIEKNGGSLLLDNILEMRKGVFIKNDKLVF